MRFAIYGAGGVGGYFGARLAQSGQSVVFVARGEHLAAIRSDGLHLESVAGDHVVVPAEATDDPAAVGPVDAVILGVKAWQVSEAARAMLPMLRADSVVLPLQNGVLAPEELAAVVGPERVLGGLCRLMSFIAAPGRIRHPDLQPQIQLGEMDARPSERVETLRAAFAACIGVSVVVPPDIRVALWEKFLFIAPFSGLAAAARVPAGILRGVPETRERLRRAMEEVAAVARARGIELGEDAVERTLAFMDRLGPEVTASMQRDIAEGRPSELEYQTGAVVRLGRELGVPTPVNDLLYATLLPAERRTRGVAPDAGLESAREGPPDPANAATEAPSGAPPRFLAALGRRLTWRPVAAGGHGSSDWMIALCAMAALAVWLAFDRYAAGRSAHFWPAGVTGIAWFAAGLFALAFVLHRVSRPASGFRGLLAAIVAGVPLLLAVALAVRQWAPEDVRGPAQGALALAAALYVWRSLARAGGTRALPAMVAAGLFALAFAWGTESAFVDPSLWYPAPEEDGEARSWEAAERLLFEQADRIDAAAARLSHGTAGRPDVFFLGFAGVGEEKVFAEEIQLSARVVSERYGGAGRTLLLVNDKRDRDRFPLATVHGLRRALGRMAEHMDREEDVLFLMLTSHGSDDPSLSVSNGAWPLEQLDAAGLRTALDESRIKWRVIVISACHSGAFIGPLADENSIVLTSAAADRTSFGCSDEREITDFGAAFIRDALPRAPSLAGAFDQAKRAIAEREKRDGLPASLPQAHVGHTIRSYWERVEAER